MLETGWLTTSYLKPPSLLQCTSIHKYSTTVYFQAIWAILNIYWISFEGKKDCLKLYWCNKRKDIVLRIWNSPWHLYSNIWKKYHGCTFKSHIWLHSCRLMTSFLMGQRLLLAWDHVFFSFTFAEEEQLWCRRQTLTGASILKFCLCI